MNFVVNFDLFYAAVVSKDRAELPDDNLNDGRILFLSDIVWTRTSSSALLFHLLLRGCRRRNGVRRHDFDSASASDSRLGGVVTGARRTADGVLRSENDQREKERNRSLIK